MKLVNIASKVDLKGRALVAAKNANPIGGFFGGEEGEQAGQPSGPAYGLLNFLLSKSLKEEPKRRRP